MQMKTKLSKTLIELAEISPKNNAKRILKRNESLMKKLMLLKPYVGKTIGDIPDEVLRKTVRDTNYGCPHCYQNCANCPWMKVTHSSQNRYEACCDVMFNGISLHSISRQHRVGIFYLENREGIELDNTSDLHDMDQEAVIDEKEWENCCKFLQGHIDWAKLDCWEKRHIDKPGSF